MPSRLLTIGDVADRLACSQRTAERLVKSGQVKSVKMGGLRRIREEWIEDYIQRHEIRVVPRKYTRRQA